MTSAPADPDPALQAALEAFFASHYRRRPVDATFIGVHEHDDRLPDFSERGVADALSEIDGLLERFRALARGPRATAPALERDLAEAALEIQRWEYLSSHFHRGNPCVYTGEAVFGVIGLFLRPFAPPAQRAGAAVARLSLIPRLLSQGRANVRQAPAAWIDRAVRECAGARAFLDGGIAEWVRSEGITDSRIRAAAQDAAAAFAEFEVHLTQTLRPRATGAYACGEEALDLLLRRGHLLDGGAAAVRAAALERVAACEEALRRRAAEAGAADWRGALAQLAERHPSAAGYYGRYREIWEAARAAAEEHRLVTWPDAPIQYVPQPRWARAAAPSLYFLAYRSPAPLDRLPVTDYLVTPVEPDLPAAEQARRLRAQHDGAITLNHVIHHGGLGHHVQNWHAARAASRIGRVAAADCAARIALFCGGTMAEGWACYAVDLMEEIGFLDPLTRCAQAHTRLRQAVRALADVDLHRGACTLDAAAALYMERAGMTPEAARAEAAKNSMFPGTALMYMVGTDLIHALRRELASRGGGRFDLRAFHDRFLAHGSVPVSRIAAAMREEAARSP